MLVTMRAMVGPGCVLRAEGARPSLGCNPERRKVETCPSRRSLSHVGCQNGGAGTTSGKQACTMRRRKQRGAASSGSTFT